MSSTGKPQRQSFVAKMGVLDYAQIALNKKENTMNESGRGYIYADQKDAEEQANRLRASLSSLVETLEELNGSIDSLKLAQLIENAKFKFGI